jgi:predicted nucleotidyltransferase component of viral defense system
MSAVALPPLPPRELLADRCREVAEAEGVQPDLVEKDFYLTRLLWALGQSMGDRLLLKGGTLLSKVDLGFFRMSEDADFVMPRAPGYTKGVNVRALNEVRAALKLIAPLVGVRIPFPHGEDYDKGTHRVWSLEYESEFPKQALRLEVLLRVPLLPPRKVQLSQLVDDPGLGDQRPAFCWAMDRDEARAEKVRAAVTREAIRDYYDLDRLLDSGADLSSRSFRKLVDAKLAEQGAPPLSEQRPAPFGLNDERYESLRRSLKDDLLAVLRIDAPPFDLDRTIARFQKLWSG